MYGKLAVRRLRIIGLLVGLAGVMIVGVPGAFATTCANWSGSQPAQVGTSSEFHAVAIVDRCTAWAVGQSNAPLIERWRGSSWHMVPAQAPPGSSAVGLTGVAAVSGSSAWTVGYYVTGSSFRPLIEHWNGSKWSIQTSASPGSSHTLTSVAASSATDVWAVGGGLFIEHWNGSAWRRSKAPSPAGATSAGLAGVVARSPSNAWAVGSYYKQVGAGQAEQTLILHWNGRAWKIQKTPNPGGSTANTANGLSSVTATSAKNAWAVGNFFDYGASQYRALMLHWNGTAWKVQPSKSTPDYYNQLLGISAASPSSVWAVGYHAASIMGVPQPRQTLIEHWDGVSWSIQASPNPGGSAGDNQLEAVAAATPASVWAVGYFTNGSQLQALALHCC